jgi:hypothetical protein
MSENNTGTYTGAMMYVNVRIQQSEPQLSAPTIDATTQKRVEFQISDAYNGRTFKHVIVAGGRDFDRQIEWLRDGVSFNVKEYRGDEPSPEWKEEVVRSALGKVVEVDIP